MNFARILSAAIRAALEPEPVRLVFPDAEYDEPGPYMAEDDGTVWRDLRTCRPNRCEAVFDVYGGGPKCADPWPPDIAFVGTPPGERVDRVEVLMLPTCHAPVRVWGREVVG